MTKTQKLIKVCAIVLAALLIASMVITALRVLSVLFSLGKDDGMLTPVELGQDYRSLELDLAATSIEIRIGEAFKVESSGSRLRFETDRDTLSVEEFSYGLFDNRKEGLLVLTVPADYVFDSVEISAGAGYVTVESLSAARIEMELGAGEAEFEELNASVSADIEGGAGKLRIHGGSICGLDLDMGVGELALTAELNGNASIDCGIGTVSLVLLGDADRYTVLAEKGIGAIRIDGEALGNSEPIGSGENRVSISGGVGEITVRIGEDPVLSR